MKTKIKEQKGITLIALVITIIVLLILAGVAISMLSGENGILNQAVKAKIQTEKKSEEEVIKISAMTALTLGDGEIEEDTLKSELNSQLGIGKYTITSKEDGWVVITEAGNHYGITSSGEAKYLAWYFTDDKKQITNGTQTLTIGDIVEYDPTTKLTGDVSYESESEKNGYSNQTFTLSKTSASQQLTWGVIGVDDDGNVLIAPTTGIKNESGNLYQFYLKGKAGIQYGIEELNNIAKMYGNGKGAISARSIKVKDINNVVGYTPEETNTTMGSYGAKVTYSCEVEGEIKYSWVNNNGENITGNFDCNEFTYWDGKQWKGLGIGERVTVINTKYTFDITEHIAEGNNLINIIASNFVCWTGDTCVNPREENVEYNIGCQNGYEWINVQLFSWDYGEEYDYNPICPVVSLSPNIRFGGNSTDGWTIK